MGETVIEKIIRNNVGKAVKPGDIVTVNVDRVMLDDIMIPFIVDKFHEMGFAKEVADEVWFMSDGYIQEKGNPKDFFNAPKTDRAKEFLAKIL